jgi:hypothetical protein
MSESSPPTTTQSPEPRTLLPQVILVVTAALLVSVALLKVLRSGHEAHRYAAARRGALRSREMGNPGQGTEPMMERGRPRQQAERLRQQELEQQEQASQQAQEDQPPAVPGREERQALERALGTPEGAVGPAHIHLAIEIIVSLALLAAALAVVLSRKYNPKDKYWAYAALGIIVGYWLKL